MGIKQGRKAKRFSLKHREDRDTWQFSLHEECGLPADVCAQWKNKSFQTLPHEVSLKFREVKTRTAAERVIEALILFLRGHEEALPLVRRGTRVGDWMELFTKIETSPRATRLISKNKPYSPETVMGYENIFRIYLKDDTFSDLAMERVTSDDILALLKRISNMQICIGRRVDSKLKSTPKSMHLVAGSPRYEKIYGFMRMTFREFQLTHKHFYDPFTELERPKAIVVHPREGLEESEITKLFSTPGVFETSIERAMAAAIFWAGLRRSELFGLMPEDLDWKTPKINVDHAWKCLDCKSRVLGDPKHHKHREAPFPDILQSAIKVMWAEYGQHEFVFAFKDGHQPSADWYRIRVYRWFKRAGIELGGRKITPHSARHSLASVLEAQGVPLRYIQNLLGHSDLKTTLGYLHTPQGKINEITAKINATK